MSLDSNSLSEDQRNNRQALGMLKNKQINRQKMLLSPGAGNFRGARMID